MLRGAQYSHATMRAACGSLRVARAALRAPCGRGPVAFNVSTAATATIGAMVQKLDGPSSVTSFIEDVNVAYEKVHKAYEHNFWATKMNLKGNSTDDLAKTKTDYEAFLGNAELLAKVRQHLQDPGLSSEQRKVLSIMERTFTTHIMEDPAALALKEELNNLEAELAQARNGMALGYTDPATGEFKACSSVQLRTMLQVEPDEKLRKLAHEALSGIGPFVAEKFLVIVKKRNQLARLLGFEDFYDYKVSSAEGFGKGRLFEMMDDLEEKTRPLMEAARQRLAADKGEAALEPHNISHALSGDTTKATDPYFPFEDAVDVWARTFAGLGINYCSSTMTLDLCDRQGKYSNGFCHWPQCAWRKGDGSWVPAVANFTSLATPSQVGSGKTALVTLLHEGGHAAHFANVDQHSPLFSQERAPTSVAYAENQSMFLDSLARDAAWLGRYALNREGQPIPWEVVADMIRDTHPYEVFMVRTMLAVPYFEKALYELPEDQLTVDSLLTLAAETEKRIQGGPASRPIMTVPHILADEASCYYHGYVLAEMSVHQTRDHFLKKLGRIVDQPEVGAALTRVYWRPGNSAAFLDLVQQLTGAPLGAEPWVAALQVPVDQLLEEEKKEYEAAIKEGPKYPPGSKVDLDMTIRLVDGDTLIADSAADGGIQAACDKFKAWVRQKFFAAAAS